MELTFGPEIIASYKRLSYKSWYAFAEFIDNSTQAYIDHREEVQRCLNDVNENLHVKIDIGIDKDGEYVSIIDNSYGMDEETLKHAVIIGYPPKDTSGRSRYGLGLKTAACWLGDFWTIQTKRLGDKFVHNIEIDVNRIAHGNKDLFYQRALSASIDEHFTRIVIRKLHRNLRASKTIGKIKDYLSSIYRYDFSSLGLDLYWQGEKLGWDFQKKFDERLIKNRDGSLTRKSFEYYVGSKKITGWVGVFEKGSRNDAGFSIIQNNRVIVGWPDSYRPITIYGDTVGGSNDLVNQRLVGEIFMNEFQVSHTKDEILFENDEQEELEYKLAEECHELRLFALQYRKYLADEREGSLDDLSTALNEFSSEINSGAVKDFIRTYSIPSITLVKDSNNAVREDVMKRVKPSLKAQLGEVEVWLYIVEDMSPYEPYVIVESTVSKSMVIIIINKSHPHWKSLTNVESILNFIRHCVYDGVAEWKAYFYSNRIDPETIKLLKDNLLRIPFSLKVENKI